MYQYGEVGLIKLMPYSIRIELLKRKLIEVYKTEVEYNKALEMPLDIRQKYFNKLDDITQTFVRLLEAANLPNEELVELYIFAKQARIESELEDNLFNLNKNFLYGYKEEHDEINEKIKKRIIL